jgi:hypothetical protein
MSIVRFTYCTDYLLEERRLELEGALGQGFSVQPTDFRGGHTDVTLTGKASSSNAQRAREVLRIFGAMDVFVMGEG